MMVVGAVLVGVAVNVNINGMPLVDQLAFFFVLAIGLTSLVVGFTATMLSP